jgi:hypothetical protein
MTRGWSLIPVEVKGLKDNGYSKKEVKRIKEKWYVDYGWPIGQWAWLVDRRRN